MKITKEELSSLIEDGVEKALAKKAEKEIEETVEKEVEEEKTKIRVIEESQEKALQEEADKAKWGSFGEFARSIYQFRIHGHRAPDPRLVFMDDKGQYKQAEVWNRKDYQTKTATELVDSVLTNSWQTRLSHSKRL